MTITKIQNPYKLAEMKSFSYQPKDLKEQNEQKVQYDNNNVVGAVSKGFGIITPPSKSVAEPTPQDKLELSTKVKKELNKDIDNARKTKRTDSDLPTPLGVKIIAGVVGLTIATALLKKAGVFSKIASVFKKA
ncbi:hypothetical protein IJI31_04095 [bacterium]|nr:hypothetical protein [bacterium]